jgi:hypothetical protein
MTKNNLTKELVSRTNQMSFFKYIGVLPNPDKLFLQHGKTYQTYRDLKNDPHLWACIQSRKSGVISYKYEIQQNNSDNNIFNFIKYNIDNINIERLIRQMLEAVLMGFQVFEIIWQPIYFGNNLLYSIKSIDVRPQEYFYFDVKGNLKLKSDTMNYLSGVPKYKTNLPKYKTLLVQHEADYDNPYGQPLLSKCY